MKIIAFYLPQFHQTKENDEWWGEGFTEWTNVKKSEPLFGEHYQPRIPQNEKYYDLLDTSVMKWQTEMAKEYGIYGFCVYHYWSEQGMLLNRPWELYLQEKMLDFPYCFCWANETWTNSWATNARNPKVLWEQTYGDEMEWKRHFEYLLPFFKDERYIKEKNKPLLLIYRPERINRLNVMLDYLNDLAILNGFDGIAFASQQKEFHIDNYDDSRFTYKVEYQPNFAEYDCASRYRRIVDGIKSSIIQFVEKYTPYSIPKMRGLVKISYEKVWEAVIKRQPDDEKMIPGAFVDWDNTPRYGNKGKVYIGASPDKFKEYLKKQIIHTRDDYKKDKLFLFAWNEWSEGGYLEPDEKWGTEYLKAIKEALEETGEEERN